MCHIVSSMRMRSALNTSFQRFLSYYRKVSVVLFWKQLVQNTVERISSRVTLMSVASRRLPCL